VPGSDVVFTNTGDSTNIQLGVIIPVGSNGEQGEAGAPGTNGATGDTGAPGTNGLDGTNGYTPIKGVDYFDGSNGIDGVDGTNGINGTNGYTPIKGVDYFDGTNGVDGIDGTNGADGAIGPAGTNGIDGINGTNGIDGVDGTNGVDGAVGPAGPVTNQIMAADGILYTITNTPTENYELKFNPANSTAWFAMSGFVGRTNELVNYDYTTNNLTCDAAYHSLVITNIVPASAKYVVVRGIINASQSNKILALRPTGITSFYLGGAIRTQVASVSMDGIFIIPLASGSIDYYVSTNVAAASLSITGWGF